MADVTKKKAKKKVKAKSSKPVRKKQPRKRKAAAPTVVEEISEDVLSQLDGFRFSALDSELRNHLQGIKIADLEIDKETRRANDVISKLNEHKKQLKQEYDLKKVEYDELVKRIASERGLDYRKMSINSDTFVVRDLRQ